MLKIHLKIGSPTQGELFHLSYNIFNHAKSQVQEHLVVFLFFFGFVLQIAVLKY